MVGERKEVLTPAFRVVLFGAGGPFCEATLEALAARGGLLGLVVPVPSERPSTGPRGSASVPPPGCGPPATLIVAGRRRNVKTVSESKPAKENDKDPSFDWLRTEFLQHPARRVVRADDMEPHLSRPLPSHLLREVSDDVAAERSSTMIGRYVCPAPMSDLFAHGIVERARHDRVVCGDRNVSFLTETLARIHAE